jgi:polysaccharide export outer membrane protein
MKRILTILTLFCMPALLPQLAYAQQDYLIKPGDTLRIEVLEDSNLNRDALVLPDGRIAVPQAGTIQAGGRSVSDVQAELTEKLGPNFAAPPNVFVGVTSLAVRQPGNGTGTPAVRTITVYVMGESANPGKYDVKRGSTLLQVLAESGGLSEFAATKRLQLRRGAAVYNFNYDALERGAVTAEPIVMSEGDVIIVPQRRLFE